MMRLPIRRVAQIASVLAACLLSSAHGQARDERIEEEINVFESRITLDFGSMSYRQVRRLHPRNLVVVEDGAPRQVTSLKLLTEAGDWRSVIYIDTPLAKSRTIRMACLALGEHIENLTAVGTVEIVVADPTPRSFLPPSRQPRILEEALTRLATSEFAGSQLATQRREFKRAREETADAPSPEEALRAELRLVRERADHLLRLAAQGGDGRPSFLFLISDGYYEDPSEFYLGSSPVPSDLRGVGEAISREVAQTFSAYEWIVSPVPLREDSPESKVSIRPTTDFDTFNANAGGVQLLPKAGSEDLELSLDDLEINISPILQPLRRLATATTGEALRLRSDFEKKLDRLQDLWRAYYLTNRPFDGTIRPTAARFVRSVRRTDVPFSRNPSRVGSAAWVRSSTPGSVVEARLREILDGDGTDRKVRSDEVELRAHRSRGEQGETLIEVSVDWAHDRELVSDGMVRLSLGYSRTGGQSIYHHTVVDGGEADDDGRWSYSVNLLVPEDAGRIALVLEALRPLSWGSAVLDSE